MCCNEAPPSIRRLQSPHHLFRSRIASFEHPTLQPSIKAAQHPLHRFYRFLSLFSIDAYTLCNGEALNGCNLRGDRSVVGGVMYYGGRWYMYMYVSVTNSNQPPRVGCLLAEKLVVALEMSIGGGGGSMPVPKIQ